MLSACGGGGSDATNPAPPTPLPPPAPDPPVSAPLPAPGSVPTPRPTQSEIASSNFLPLINAGFRYRASSGGRGIVVAVIDDGVETRHPDLDAEQFSYSDARPPAEHGTAVAGVIAARQNGRGMHGVAWNASVVSLENCFTRGSTCSATERQLGQANALASDIVSAAGLRRDYGGAGSTPEASAHIINMSWGPELGRVHYGAGPEKLSAMRAAASQGRIMVAALGNSELPGPEGGPASVVGDSRIAGLGIAVGALNASGTGAASFSNRCGTGSVAQYCLFAPGEHIYTTSRSGSRVSWGLFTGTSFATPVVSGAAAVVWGEFPNKTGRQIVARLLDTADRSGVFGNSSIYGRGRLDIEAALNPVGLTQFRLESGGTAPAHSSVVSLPSGFQAPSSVAGISSAVAYDEQDFPFRYDLNAAFQDSQSTATSGALESFMASLGGARSYVPVGQSAAFEFTVDEEDSAASGLGMYPDDRENSDMQSFEAHFQPRPEVNFSLGHHVNYSGASNRAVLGHTSGTVLSASSSVAPFTAFAERDSLGWSLAWQSDERTTVDLVGQVGEDRHGSGETRLASVGLTRRIAAGWTAGAQAGTLQEEQTLLGIRSEGGFAGLSDADTHFVDVSLLGSVTPNVTVFGSLSRGKTGGRQVDGGSSLVSGWEDMNAGSFLVGGEWTDLGVADSGRLVLTVGSPLRASNAQLRLRVPDEGGADQELSYTTEPVNLTPSGRETRVQLVYETDLSGSGQVSSLFALGGYMRLEPDHDAKADTDCGLAVKYKVQF